MGRFRARSKVATCAARALAKIGDQNLAPTPEAYSVWYHYFDGSIPDLREIVDAEVQGGASLADSALEEIYERFLSGSARDPSIYTLAESLAGEMANTLGIIETASRSAADYGSSLESVSGKMVSGLGPGELSGLIGRAISLTQSMVEHSRSVEQRLHESLATVDRLTAELREVPSHAVTDALTGLSNRAAFDGALRGAISRASETGTTLSLLFLDIDHFKRFNDTFGHQVGDQVLKLLGSVLKTHLNGKNMAARYGGEEFAVILLETQLDAAARVAETLRAAVAKKSIVDRNTGNSLGRITVSVGVARLEPGESAESLVGRADRALYAAKHKGRNRVVTDPGLRSAA